MNCTHCHYDYENTAQYCPQCGHKTLYNPTLNKSNPNVTAVWLFAGMLIGMQLLYSMLSHVIVPALRGENFENIHKITTLYRTVDILNLLLDLLVSGIIIALIRNTSARIAVGLYAGFSLFMFLLEKILSAAELGAYAKLF